MHEANMLQKSQGEGRMPKNICGCMEKIFPGEEFKKGEVINMIRKKPHFLRVIMEVTEKMENAISNKIDLLYDKIYLAGCLGRLHIVENTKQEMQKC
jgi:hypothetical protein